MTDFSPVEEQMMIACLRNGGNQSEAWKEAHPDSKAKPETIHQKASRFFSQGKVRARMAFLHAEVVEKAVGDAALTLTAHLQELKSLRDEARQRGLMGAAITAEVKRGEASRLYIKQVETGDAGEFDRMTTEELRAFVYGDKAEEQTKH